MAQASAAGTNIGDSQIYFNYNVLSFGAFIATNSKITVTKGSLLSGNIYIILSIVDHSSSRVAITNDFLVDGLFPGNALLTTPTDLLHVSIEILNESETAGLSFQHSLMEGQLFEEDGTTPYSLITGITNDIPFKPPQKFKLFQNYPNPFNPDTKIEIHIPGGAWMGTTQVSIYNSLGQKVRTLINAPLNAGIYFLTWDGKSDFGNIMPSGSYYYSVKNGGNYKIKKMLLIR